jgi:hypothetical protein
LHGLGERDSTGADLCEALSLRQALPAAFDFAFDFFWVPHFSRSLREVGSLTSLFDFPAGVAFCATGWAFDFAADFAKAVYPHPFT